MGRRRAALVALALAAGLAVAGVAVCSRRERGVADLNVVVVILDTLRADHCSFLGYPRPTTPRLAELAREGVTFTNAWSHSAWTIPAHATLFTGQNSGRHGCGRDGSAQLRDTSTTLAELLRAAGWATGCWSANPFVSKPMGLTQGFDVEDRQLGFITNPGPTLVADDANQRALQWMRAQTASGKRFFAFLNHMEAHAPYAPPEPWAARFRRGAPDDPAAREGELRALTFPQTMVRSVEGRAFTEAERRRLDDLYDADIASMDDAMGRLVATLREDGILDRTLLVVAADHGEGLGDHSWIEHTLGLWTELLRVPLIVRLPGRYDGGRVVNDLVRLEDVFPTVLEACGIPVPQDVDGAALDRGLPGRVAFGAQDAMPGGWPRVKEVAPHLDLTRLGVRRRSVTDGRYHLIQESTGAVGLFDLASDPGELREISEQHPGEVTRLRDLLSKSPTR